MVPQNPGAKKLLPHNPGYDMRKVGIRYSIVQKMKLRTESSCNHARGILLKLFKLVSRTSVPYIAPVIKLDNHRVVGIQRNLILNRVW